MAKALAPAVHKPAPHARGAAKDPARGGFRASAGLRAALWRPAAASAAARRHEAEAERASAAVLGGRTEVAKWLSAAAPASVSVPGSPGTPLDPRTRQRLERGFGADLGAVRLHTDANAAAAARVHAARGFAAGRDVYVDLPAHALDSERGLGLLAHEVAHSLQQTARAGADGTPRVTHVVGNALPQRAPDFAEELKTSKLLVEGPFDLAMLEADHRAAHPSDAALEAEIAKIEGMIGTDFAAAPASGVALLVAEVATPRFEVLAPYVKGFYVDCLNALGKHPDAVTVQRAALRGIPTRLRSLGFYREFRKTNGVDWLPSRIATIAVLKDYFPGDTSSAYFIYFNSFHLGVVPLRNGKLGDDAQAFIKGLITGAQSGNELDIAATVALTTFDRERGRVLDLRNEVRRQAYEADPNRNTLLDLKVAVATEAASDTMRYLPGDVAELLALSRSIEPTIRGHAERAAKLWGLAKGIETTGWDGKERSLKGLGDPEVVKGVAQLGTFPPLAMLDSTVANAIRPFFAAGPTPTPDDGAKLRATAVDALFKLGKQIELKLIALATAKQRKDPSGDEIKLALGLYVTLALRALFAYDADEDRSWRGRDLEDYWLATRLRLSMQAKNVGEIFGLPLVAKVGESYRAPDRAELSLLGSWSAPIEAEFGEAVKDLAGEPRGFEGTGITWSLIEKFAFLGYYKELKEQLTTLLAGPATSLAPRDQPILDQALEEAHKRMRRPARVMMSDARWFLGANSKKTLGDLVWEHPRANELRAKVAGGDLIGVPDAERVHLDAGPNTIVAWVFPGIDKLADGLRNNVPGLDDKVRAQYRKVHKEDAPKDLSWFQWLEMLASLARDLAKDPAGRAEGKDLAKTVRSALGDEAERYREAVRKEVHRAVLHQRLSLEVNELWPELAKFNRNDLERIPAGHRIRDLVRTFVDFVWRATRIAVNPDAPAKVSASEIVEVQATALLLESSLPLTSAFAESTGLLGTGPLATYTVIGWLIPAIGGALETWRNGALQPSVIEASVHDPGTLEEDAKRLDVLRSSFLKVVEGAKRDFGIKADAKTKTLTTLGSTANATFRVATDPKKMEGSEFTYGGIVWRLVDVHKSFIWYSPYRYETIGVPWRTPDTSGDALLFEADGKTPLAKANDPLITLEKTHLPGFEMETVVLRDRDDEALDQLEAAIAINAIAEQLKALGETMEAVAEFAMDVLEFVPGIGQAVMGVRLVQAIFRFMTDDDFKEVLKAFKEDGIGAIPELLKKVVKLFDPMQLIEYLLFQADRFPFGNGVEHPGKKSKKTDEITAKTGTFATVAKALKDLLAFGDHVIKVLNRLRIRAQLPVRAIRLWIVEHPLVGMILGFILDYVVPIAELTIDRLTSGDDASDKDSRSAVTAAAQEGIGGLIQSAVDAVATLSFFQLPESIFPYAAVVDFVLSEAISHLPAKFKIALKGVQFFLKKLNVWSKLMDKIGRGIASATNLDPDKFYQKEVRDKLQPHLDEIRASFVKTLLDFMGEIPIVKDHLPQPTSEEISVEFSGEGFPEAQASPATDPFPELPHGPLPLPSGGDPLDPDVQTRSELSLGHDLGHVRLHQGADAERLTSSFHADALATGSHVYLRPGLSPSEGRGEHVLRHELSHVIDQTGPRPVGGDHPATPSAGEPGAGLRWDAASERRADDVAHGVARPDGGNRGGGVQPSFTTEFFMRFLRDLRDPAALKRAAKKTETLENKPVSFGEDKTSQDLAMKLSQKFVPAFQDPKILVLPAPFDKVATEINAYVKAHASTLAQAIPRLVFDVRTFEKLKKKAGREATEAPWVSPSALATELGEFIYGDTGLAAQVKFYDMKDPDLDYRRVVASDNPFRSIKVLYIHLPYMQGTTGRDLVIKAVDNTFGSKAASADDKADYVTAAEMVLSRLGPRPDVWQSGAFKFTELTEKRIEEQRRSNAKVLGNKVWPSPSDYAQPDPSKITDAKLQWNGLRVGTYGDLRAAVSGAKTDWVRDAHHVTQYVFLDYLRNQKMLKPFPHLGTVDYPGVNPPGSKLVDTIDPLGGPATRSRFRRTRRIAVV